MSATAKSQRLSYLLRHAPEDTGLCLGKGGWVELAELIEGLARSGTPMTEDEVREVVKTSDKKRFTLSDDGRRIRAAQGHSVKIESDLVPVTPPATLYHGTASKTVDAIIVEGLKPMSRLQVNLSGDTETAIKVGQRHGKPVVLTGRANAMADDGHDFFRADNGVWLTAAVPPQYLIFEGSN